MRLIAFQSGNATLTPRAVAAFHERHPQVELSMQEAEPDQVAPRLRTGEADLALVYDHPSAPDMLPADLELVHLLDDPYDVILPAGHALAKRRRVSLADLAEDPWIASGNACGCRAITDGACREAGFEPRVAFEADETTAAQALVAAGVGVTIFPRLALTTLHPGVVARRLVNAPVRRVWAARAEGFHASPASDAMMQILGDVAEEFRDAKLRAGRLVLRR